MLVNHHGWTQVHDLTRGPLDHALSSMTTAPTRVRATHGQRVFILAMPSVKFHNSAVLESAGLSGLSAWSADDSRLME